MSYESASKAMALTHSEGDLLRKLRFCLVKDRLTLQQKTSGTGLIKHLKEVFLPEMTALFSCLLDAAVQGIRWWSFIFILLLDSLGNDKQHICVPLAIVKYEHCLVLLRFKGSLEIAKAWKCSAELLKVSGWTWKILLSHSVRYSKILPFSVTAKGLMCI